MVQIRHISGPFLDTVTGFRMHSSLEVVVNSTPRLHMNVLLALAFTMKHLPHLYTGDTRTMPSRY